jgi:transcriptional regulator with GAF, ATPase, and Fis domain
VILARGGLIHFDLRAPIRAAVPARSNPAAPLPLLTRAAIERHQRESIAVALAQTGGKVSGAGGAAALLGIKPTTLYSRILALGLRRASA